MAPAHGRPPSKDPKRNDTRIRLTDSERKKLEFCAQKTGMTRADIIRKGIDLIYQSEIKYDKSFQVDKDEIPRICPKCGGEFEIPGDIDTSPYEQGYLDVLMCSNCDYEKILAYTTEEDVEAQMQEDMEPDL